MLGPYSKNLRNLKAATRPDPFCGERGSPIGSGPFALHAKVPRHRHETAFEVATRAYLATILVILVATGALAAFGEPFAFVFFVVTSSSALIGAGRVLVAYRFHDTGLLLGLPLLANGFWLGFFAVLHLLG
ncbi:MAG: hypothetical protein ACYS0E_14920 [Planctomycetota bacterium]|jgi:hypothetical protein